MERRRLGRTDINVTAICLGTMTWGLQNTEAEGHEQLDYALAQGIDFIDTAEMYAVPPSAATYGKTEEIIGTWLAKRRNRAQIFLASKIAGPGHAYMRGGTARLDRANIAAAVEASLRRLQTDYIDLYQLHWPNRHVNAFGRRDWSPKADEDFLHPAETLAALDEQVKAGRIRHVGVSNETPWGLMTFLALADQGRGPRMVSIQNAYNLLNRSFEVGLAECAVREQASLLGYAPLAAGTLTGKYLGGKKPPGSRRAVDHRKSRYDTLRAEVATETYLDIARRYGLDPAQMAIAWALSRPFMTSVIIGATSMAQLKTNIAARDLRLFPEVLAELDHTHELYPNPCP